jgi:histidyl-tRNA synthetase
MPPQITPRLPKGMRDFTPADMLRRQYVINTITDVFQTFGFEPIQTPVMELHETLMGKYGDDAEKLIYQAQHVDGKETLALRYDLTVPLARFYAQHESELALPFRRYHIAPVWRAERPQRGRYREFYQCDADIVGASGADADAEIVSLIVAALERLGFNDFLVKVNHRKLLTGIGQYAGLTGDALSSLYRTIDKTDKIGLTGVRDEFLKNGLAEDVITRMIDLLAATQQATDMASSAQVISTIRGTLQNFPEAMTGLNDLEGLFSSLTMLGIKPQRVGLDFTMVRGLSYYTGPIFETVLLSDDPEERVGSVSGGGRYDELIGLFRKESIPTVGMSLGIERLIDLLDKRKQYPANMARTVVQTLVTVFNAETHADSLKVLAMLRQAGIRSELYMQDKPVGKQINYADKKGIPLIVVIGPDEARAGQVKIKRLTDGAEQTVALGDVVNALQAWL